MRLSREISKHLPAVTSLLTSRAHRKKKPGTAPGTLIYEGHEPDHPVRLQVYDYDVDHLEERELDDAAACAMYREQATTTWINVDGVYDVNLIERLGTLFDIHTLTLEDIVSTDQRPKVEEYPAYIYVVLQMMHYEHEQALLVPEQVSLIIRPGIVLSFQESIKGDLFDPVRQRLRDNQGRIRAGGADYLAYALIDVIVDHYMDILESLGEHIEDLEDEVTTHPSPDVMHRINRLRRKIVLLRRSVWPLRDVIMALERSERPFMSQETDIFFRDVYDHTVRTIEIIESAREVLATLTDLHLSTLSFRMNEIMKILAIIATFFLPLTFIAGIYGMNFNPDASPLNMPELNWFFGYPFALGIMVCVALGMYIFFRRKGWL